MFSGKQEDEKEQNTLLFIIIIILMHTLSSVRGIVSNTITTTAITAEAEAAIFLLFCSSF